MVAAVSSILPHNVETTTMSSNDAEQQGYEDDVKALKQWWSDSRWRQTRRPYTAEQIATKRGNLKIEYPSNAISKKLWKMLEKRFAVGRIQKEQRSIPGADHS